MLKLRRDSDSQVLERIRSNDRTVLGEIFIQYRRMVFSYIETHGGTTRDAEDILQESIIVLWQKVNERQFTLSAKLGTYLLAVAKHKWMGEIRRKHNVTHPEIPEDIPDGNPTSLQMLVSGEKLEWIRQALDMIQPICKKILLLYYFEEKNMEEIGRIIGFANPDVVKSKKYQCKKSLEEILKKRFHEFEENHP